MKHVSETIPSILTQPTGICQPVISKQNQPGLSSNDGAVVNEAMKQLKAIFPAWRSGIKNQRDYDAYAGQLTAALIDHGISSVLKLQIGLKRARDTEGRQSAFLPNPGTFAKWCKPYAAPCHRPFDESNTKQIEQKVSSPERRRLELANLKRICRGEGPTTSQEQQRGRAL